MLNERAGTIPGPSGRRRPSPAFVAVLALAVASCGIGGGNGGGDDAAGTTAPPPATTTTASATTTSTTAPPPPSAPAGASSTTTTTVAPPPPLDPAQLPGGVLAACESPAGFAIGHPASWLTNPGDVVPACSQFHPQPFQLPPASDARVAAVVASVQPVPFADLAAPRLSPEQVRAETTVDGLPAVRLEYQDSGQGLWPAGTPITQYLVDLSPSGRNPQTLSIDTIGLEGFDYATNQVVLDRMVRTLRVTRPGVPVRPEIVARSVDEGGYTVLGTVNGPEVCLGIEFDKEQRCSPLPGPQQVTLTHVIGLQPFLAGVTGDEVFRVTATLKDGSLAHYLPAAIAGGVRGFAFPFDLEAVSEVTASDVTGRTLAVLPGG